MDRNKIEKAIVIASDALTNENLSHIIETNPKKLIGLDLHILKIPLTERRQRLERAVNQYQLRGLKLVPDFQNFSMNDYRIEILIRKAVELSTPVIVHSAPGLIQGHYNSSLPEHFDLLKSKIPELTLIISHMSYPCFLDLRTVVSHKGVYVDTSTTLPWIIDLLGIDSTSRYIRCLGVEKILFGSDWWGPNGEMEKQVQSIEKLDLTKEEREKILGKNISKILNLKI